MTLQKQLEYVHPGDTQWVEDHLNDPKVCIAEVDYDRKTNYELGHIPGSVLLEKGHK
jgi:3-mercaptopyruvate sulfurtransferase SseA